MKTDECLGNLCKALETKHGPRCFKLGRIISPRFFKQNHPKYISDVASKILEKKTQLSDVLSEFVIFLKLGFLW